MRHPHSIKLFEYWRSLKNDSTAPMRYDVDPTQITKLLPDIFICDLNPERAAIKLAGSRLCTLFDRELRHVDLAMLFSPKDQATPTSICKTIANDEIPALFGLMGHAMDERLSIECLLLPLKDKEEKISSIMGIISPLSNPPWIGHKPLLGFEVLSFRLLWNCDELVLANPNSLMAATLSTIDQNTNIPHSNDTSRAPFLRVIDGGLKR